MPTKSNDLAARLRRLMKAQGWTQAEMAKAAGASKQTVSRWMSDGQIRIDPKFAFRLEDGTGFAARWLLTGSGPVDAVAVARRMLQRHESRVRD